MNFSDKIVAYIAEHQLDFNHLCIVLPSERAIKYIAASIYKQSGKPVIAPEMLTIDQLIRKCSTKKIVDKTRLLIQLFKIQNENPVNIKDKSFDEFLQWGQILLNDFEEIDRNLLDSKLVFRNLKDIKELEHWSINDDNLTPAKKRFLEFWERLPEFYQKLEKWLDENNATTISKAYKSLANDIQVLFVNDKSKIFLFAGFNALSASELQIIKQVKKYNKAHVIIDADEFYYNDTNHEAGMFLRSMMKELEIQKPSFITNNLLSNEKNIEVIETTQNTGQVKIVATILQELDQKELDETLVLLADESLIVPLLKNIPKKVGKANISIGLPFKNTAMKTWIELLLNIQEVFGKYNTKSAYFQHFNAFSTHPFIQQIASTEEKETLFRLQQDAIKLNTVFFDISKKDISPKLNEIIALVFMPWNHHWQTAVEKIRATLSKINKHLEQNDEINHALIEGFDRSITDFNNIVNEGLPEMSLNSFKQLFNQHWTNKSVAYYGNPIDGLQIMGLLETRCLDFKNLIVIGFNEGNLPPTNSIESFIPMDLRTWLKLPTVREKQGLFAHHFYRLLHQSKNIWITYLSGANSIGSNEASRYLMQLELELARENKNIHFNKKTYSLNIIENVEHEGMNPKIQKTPEIIRKLDEIFEKSLSPSSLNKFLECPLDFYYRYVLQISEEKTIEEELAANSMGELLHKALENFYTPFAVHDVEGNKKSQTPPPVSPKDVDKMIDKVDEVIEQLFNEFYKSNEVHNQGINLLTKQASKELLRNILRYDKQRFEKSPGPVFIEYLEIKLEKLVEIEINGIIKKVRLKGIIDRVESCMGKFNIIDFKSGVIKKDYLSLNGFDTKTNKMIYGKYAIQLMYYNYLFKSVLGFQADELSLISMINKEKIVENTFKNINDLTQLNENFIAKIKEILEMIYKTEEDFEHNEKAQYCMNCNVTEQDFN